MFDKRKHKVFEAAQEKGFVDRDEKLQSAFICQTFASPVVLTPMVTFFVAGQRMALVTDRNVYTLKVSKMQTTKPTGLISKHALGSASATKKALSLQLEGEEKLYAYLFQFGDMKKIAESVNGGELRGAAATAGAA